MRRAIQLIGILFAVVVLVLTFSQNLGEIQYLLAFLVSLAIIVISYVISRSASDKESPKYSKRQIDRMLRAEEKRVAEKKPWRTPLREYELGPLSREIDRIELETVIQNPSMAEAYSFRNRLETMILSVARRSIDAGTEISMNELCQLTGLDFKTTKQMLDYVGRRRGFSHKSRKVGPDPRQAMIQFYSTRK
ncbi:MAG: hypothetical protein ACFFF9_07655 [Candidatus Thorarchaeota archaeon]